MKQRSAVVRRTLIRLRSEFEHRGWTPSDGPATMLVMRRHPAAGIEHKLMVHEPLSAAELPRTDVLALACSVNFYFEQLENVICSVFGYNPETHGRVSGSLELCALAPKGACYLSSAYLVDPNSEVAVKRLLIDYDGCLEPVRARLDDLSIFAQEGYRPPSVGPWAWSLRRAAYLYLHASKERALAFLDRLEREAEEMLKELGPAQPTELPGVFGSVEKAVEAGKRQNAVEAKRMATTLRTSLLEGRPIKLPKGTRTTH